MVGLGHHALPHGYGRVVCYRDRTRELAQEHGLLLIPGCPPSVQGHLRIY